MKYAGRIPQAHSSRSVHVWHRRPRHHQALCQQRHQPVQVDQGPLRLARLPRRDHRDRDVEGCRQQPGHLPVQGQGTQHCRYQRWSGRGPGQAPEQALKTCVIFFFVVAYLAEAETGRTCGMTNSAVTKKKNFFFILFSRFFFLFWFSRKENGRQVGGRIRRTQCRCRR